MLVPGAGQDTGMPRWQLTMGEEECSLHSPNMKFSICGNFHISDFIFPNSEGYFRYEKFSLDWKFPLLNMQRGKCSVFPADQWQSRKKGLDFPEFHPRALFMEPQSHCRPFVSHRAANLGEGGSNNPTCFSLFFLI